MIEYANVLHSNCPTHVKNIIWDSNNFRYFFLILVLKSGGGRELKCLGNSVGFNLLQTSYKLAKPFRLESAHKEIRLRSSKMTTTELP